MAKQTFTTGAVLTSAQMTSLQQTAMGGGSATAKTASYVLVAADAGGTVAMNAAGATTITVNTALFAAGDTVFIQNLGAGACTVTAGTATVATAGSLILPQNDAGILYFTATGTSIFYDYIQAGAVSPLTTKGDVYTFSTSDARLAVGANGTVLTADSAEATGLKFATPAAAGGMTLINTGGTALTGAGITISSIPSTYKHLFVLIENVYFASNNGALYLRPNASGSTNYAGAITVGGGVTTDTTFSVGGEFVVNLNNTTNNTAKQKTQSAIWIYDYAGASNKFISSQTMAYNGAWNTTTTNGVWVDTTALSSLRTHGDYDFTNGTIYVYGVN